MQLWCPFFHSDHLAAVSFIDVLETLQLAWPSGPKYDILFFFLLFLHYFSFSILIFSPFMPLNFFCDYNIIVLHISSVYGGSCYDLSFTPGGMENTRKERAGLLVWSTIPLFLLLICLVSIFFKIIPFLFSTVF